MNINPGKGIYEYDVSFIPMVDSKQFRFQLLNQHREILGPAKTFDGVTLYLPYQFENTVGIYCKLLNYNLNLICICVWQVTPFESVHPVTEETIKVNIVLRQKRRAADCIHFYNVLIRKIARILGMVQITENHSHCVNSF